MKRKFWRWVGKAMTWKVISLVWGIAVVQWLTGQSQVSWGYVLLYGIPSLIFFVIHEAIWYQIKVKRRAKRDGRSSH